MSNVTVRRSNLSLRVASLAAASLLVIGVLPSNPAVASGGPTTVGEIETAFDCANDGGTAVLSEDIEAPDTRLTVAASCEAVLDLNGKTLEIRNVRIEAGATLTIKDASGGFGTLTTDTTASAPFGEAGIRTTGATLVIESGTVTVKGGGRAAGIGGSDDGDGGTVTISGGTVTATGGDNGGAGIGGGNGGDGGTVTITGGSVTASGERWGAGIGGGDEGDGGTVTISGGTVTATGGVLAAGIGGGDEGDGGTVTISGGSVVATAGHPDAEAIGAGRDGSDVGTLTLGPGAVRVDSETDGTPPLPVTSITFLTSTTTSTPSGPSFFAPGGVQPSQPVASAAFVRADGSPQPLAASAPGRDQVRYVADGIRVTLQGGPGTDVARGLVGSPAGEVVCEVCITGLTAGQVVEVWLFSTPRLVAAHLTDDAECQLFTVPLSSPLDGDGPVESGAHTLQFTLATASGLEAVNVGLTVGGLVPTSVPAGEGPVTPYAFFVLLLVVLLGVRRAAVTRA
jgi:hypothetical protein